MILQTQNISAGYFSVRKNKIILKNINLEIPANKVVILIGSNGSGKSTLLRTISGMQLPLSGKIFISSKPASEFTVKEWSENVSLVLTEKNDTGLLDVYSLVALGRTPYTGIAGKLSENDHFYVEQALKLTGLSAFSSRVVMELSDGEKQRVMIARAIAQDTPLVILDEPTAFLDAVYKRKLMEWLKQLAAQTDKSFILSTHDLNLARKFADQLLLIAGDEVRQISPDEYNEDELADLLEKNILYEE